MPYTKSPRYVYSKRTIKIWLYSCLWCCLGWHVLKGMTKSFFSFLLSRSAFSFPPLSRPPGSRVDGWWGGVAHTRVSTKLNGDPSSPLLCTARWRQRGQLKLNKGRLKRCHIAQMAFWNPPLVNNIIVLRCCLCHVLATKIKEGNQHGARIKKGCHI